MLRLLGAFLVAVSVGATAACGGNGTSTSTSTSTTSTTAATTAPPDAPVSSPAPTDAEPGEPTPATPTPGVSNSTPAPIQEANVAVAGRRARATLIWWSGVAPCHVLDRVDVDRDGSTLFVSVWMGTTDPDAVCIELAQQYTSTVDLGELDAGTWTLRWGPLPEEAVDFTV